MACNLIYAVKTTFVQCTLWTAFELHLSLATAPACLSMVTTASSKSLDDDFSSRTCGDTMSKGQLIIK